MTKRVQHTLLTVLGATVLAVGLMTTASIRPALGNPPVDKPGWVNPTEPVSSADFRIEAVTDKNVYDDSETLRLTLKLLNLGPETVYVGIGPDEPTFTTPAPGEPCPMPTGRLSIGYAVLAPLDQAPVICTATVQPDGTVTTSCDPEIRQHTLSLCGSNEVPGHSTRIISVLTIRLDNAPCFDPDDEDSARNSDFCPPTPMEPGYYLLDCYIHGIWGTELARAQQIIEIRS